MATIPDIEPAKITAGDKVTWRKSIGDYPASQGYVLTYVLAGGGSKITITAVADGDDYLVTLPSATTAAYTPGEYTWYSALTLAGERTTLETGHVTIAPDPASLAETVDLRSHARITLDAIEAVIEDRATKDQQEVTIAGDKLVRHSVESLLALRSHYKTEVAREEAAEKLAKGLSTGGRILTRFV